MVANNAGGSAGPEGQSGAKPARRRIGESRLDLIEALIESVAAVFDLVRDLTDRDQRIAGLYDIPAAEGDGGDAEVSRQLVHPGLYADIALAQAPTAQRAPRQRL